MALFNKKPDTGSTAPLYSLGLSKTVLIVGLGNPGKEYNLTRHNIGFACVDALAQALEFPAWVNKKDLSCELTSGKAGDQRIIIIKPTTYMNESGKALQAVMNFYKIPTVCAIVVHDELDLAFGKIQTKIGGGSAGHNGLKSIMQSLGEDFGRVRIGIGRDEHIDAADYVLAKFSPGEKEYISQLTREVTAILTEYLYSPQSAGLKPETRSFIV